MPTTETCVHGHLSRSCYECECESRLTGLDIENARLRIEVAAYRASSDHWERLYLGVARKKAGAGFSVSDWIKSVKPAESGGV